MADEPTTENAGDVSFIVNGRAVAWSEEVPAVASIPFQVHGSDFSPLQACLPSSRNWCQTRPVG